MLARTRHVDGHTWGVETALNQILEGASSAAEDLDRTVRSEARKERHRAALRRKYPPEISTGQPAPENPIHARRLLRRARTLVTGAQWDLLRAVGEGHEYKELASVANVAPGALRARVLRLRRTLAVGLRIESADSESWLSAAS
jgi:DNA-binding NarL/FixJ family response regulator